MITPRPTEREIEPCGVLRKLVNVEETSATQDRNELRQGTRAPLAPLCDFLSGDRCASLRLNLSRATSREHGGARSCAFRRSFAAQVALSCVHHTRKHKAAAVVDALDGSDVVHERQRHVGRDRAGREHFADGIGELQRDGNAVRENAGVVVQLR